MFYKQCNNCNARWELGTTNICTCVTNGSATISVDQFSHLNQRTWVGLTDEEIEVLAKKHNGIFYDCDIDFGRAIEAKLRSKNDRND